jgi:hypothetical protein
VASTAGGLEAQVAGARRVGEGDLDDVKARTGAAGGAVVDQQAVVGQVGHAGGGVGTALGLDGGDEVGIGGVADIEDVEAFPPAEDAGQDGLTVTGSSIGGG